MDAELIFRAWQEGDDLELNELWGDAESPSALAGRALFRPDSDSPVIRSIVAVRDGLPVAAGYIAEASVHPLRAWAYVEVAAEERREGLGAELLRRLRESVAGTSLAGLKLRAKAGIDSTGAAFAAREGFEVLQRSVMVRIEAGALPVPEPREPGSGGLEIDVVATGSVEVTEALWSWYRRVHEWDPPAELGLGRVNSLFLGVDSGARAAAVLRRDGVLRAFAVSYAYEAEPAANIAGLSRAEDPGTELLVGLALPAGPDSETHDGATAGSAHDGVAQEADGLTGYAQDVRDLLGQLAAAHPVVVEVDDAMPVIREVIAGLLDAGAAAPVSQTLILGD